MKTFELHTHTKYSPCSNLAVETLLSVLKKKGYDGVAVTDHNTMKGALEAKRLNKSTDFEVILGEEIDTDKCQVLGYYLTEEIKRGEIFSVLDEIHKQGGIAVIAHPYVLARCHLRMPIEKIKAKIEAIECFNGRAFPFENSRAIKVAAKESLARTAGSDSHYAFEIGGASTSFDDSLNLVKALRQKKTIIRGRMINGLLGNTLSIISTRPIKIINRFIGRRK